MRMYKFLYLVLIYFLCSTAIAAELPYAGIWRGTIGADEVQVCFDSADAQYYFFKDLRGKILLSDDEQFREWRESPGRFTSDKTPTWKINKVTEDTIEGSWNDTDSKNKLELKLKRVADVGKDNPIDYYPCGQTFFAPIINAIPLQYGPASDNRKNLRDVKTKFADAFELPAHYAGAKKFNQYVHAWLKEQTVNAYTCHLQGGQDNYEIELAGELLTDQYLVVRETLFDIYCGGAHNSSYGEHRTYDVKTGMEIDTWTWINNGSASTESASDDAPSSWLKGQLEKLNPSTLDPELAGDCNYNFSVYKPYPTESGLAFETGYGWAGRVCDSTIKIPYSDLKNHLTPAGQAVAKHFSGRTKK